MMNRKAAAGIRLIDRVALEEDRLHIWAARMSMKDRGATDAQIDKALETAARLTIETPTRLRSWLSLLSDHGLINLEQFAKLPGMGISLKQLSWAMKGCDTANDAIAEQIRNLTANHLKDAGK